MSNFDHTYYGVIKQPPVKSIKIYHINKIIFIISQDVYFLDLSKNTHFKWTVDFDKC